MSLISTIQKPPEPLEAHCPLNGISLPFIKPNRFLSSSFRLQGRVGVISRQRPRHLKDKKHYSVSQAWAVIMQYSARMLQVTWMEEMWSSQYWKLSSLRSMCGPSRFW